MAYTLQFQKTDTLASTMAAGATSFTLSSGNFGSPSGAQIYVIDYDVPAKAEVVYASVDGTAGTSVTRARDNTSDVEHASGAKVGAFFTPSHYAAITSIIDKSSGHVVITPDANKLVKVSVLRQDDTTNTYSNNQIILTGWGYKQGDGTGATPADTVTFGITFASVPIILISKGAYKNSADATGPDDQTGNDIGYAMHSSDTTTGFNAYMRRESGNWGTGNYPMYTWVAIGTLS